MKPLDVCCSTLFAHSFIYFFISQIKGDLIDLFNWIVDEIRSAIF
jgi:hypothetical protein